VDVLDGLGDHLESWGDCYFFIIFIIVCLWAGGAFN
jgi:hypothetical protein